MKVASLIKAIGSKKALVAVTGIGASATVLSLKNDSTPADDHSSGATSEARDHVGEDWFATSLRRASHFRVALSSAVGSATVAWKEGRETGNKGHPAATAMAELLATLATTSVAATSDGRGNSFKAVGTSVMDWLLEVAVDSEPTSPEVVALERYLLLALNDVAATEALLSRPGAPSKLVNLAGKLPDLRRALSKALVSSEDYNTTSSSKQQQNNAALQLHEAAATADVQYILDRVRRRNQLPQQRQLMLRMIQCWAESSIVNCTTLGRAGVGGVLVDLAAASNDGDVDLRYMVARIMDRLARDTPPSLHKQLRLEAWPYQLLCFTADAAGNEDSMLTNASLNALASALTAGSKGMSEELVHSLALPLLWKLARSTDHQSRNGTKPNKKAHGGGGGLKKLSSPSQPSTDQSQLETPENLEWIQKQRLEVKISETIALKAAIAKVIRALGDDEQHDGSQSLAPEERSAWTELLLQWLVETADKMTINSASHAAGYTQQRNYNTSSTSSTSRSISILRPSSVIDANDKELRACTIAALTALSSPSGAFGMHVAHSWLAELIIQLSTKIQPVDDGNASQQPWFFQKWFTPSTPNVEDTQRDDGDVDGNTWSSWAKSWLVLPSLYGNQQEEEQQRVLPQKRTEEENLDDLAAQAEIDEIIAEETTAVGGTLSSDTGDDDGSSSAEESPSKKSWWWPLGGSTDEDSMTEAEARASSASVSDPELSMLVNASTVGPVYARSVAAELLEASGRVGTSAEPPPYAEDALSAAALSSYPRVAAVIDFELADKALTQALKVLCALGVGGESRRSWLLSTGILPLLRRLALDHGRDATQILQDDDEEGNIENSEAAAFQDPLPLGIRRQAARLVALLTMEDDGSAEVYKDGWVPWLQEAASSPDCKVSSSAAKALLNIESTACCGVNDHPKTAAQYGFSSGKCRSPTTKLVCPPESLLPARKESTIGGIFSEIATELPNPHVVIGTALTKVKETLEELEERTADLMPTTRKSASRRSSSSNNGDHIQGSSLGGGSMQRRMVLEDGVYLFDPLAPHHAALARSTIPRSSSGEDSDTKSEDITKEDSTTATTGLRSLEKLLLSSRYKAPTMDVVFIHGMRGGAFATWRREGSLARGQARDSLERDLCWPASWLAPELPQVRLLSVEYAAPATGWEGESLPFAHTVAQIANRLAAAGVGSRPVVFICHSMGGLLVKELLSRGSQPNASPGQKRISEATTGVVFYSVPHFGAKLADWGWNLRYVGGSPARHVAQLRTGPHLEELNNAVRGMAKKGKLSVLSFSEGKATKLSYVSTQIVPHESAYPGYGEFVVLHNHDHIGVCKPRDKDDPSYAYVLRFLQKRAKEAARAEMDTQQ